MSSKSRKISALTIVSMPNKDSDSTFVENRLCQAKPVTPEAFNKQTVKVMPNRVNSTKIHVQEAYLLHLSQHLTVANHALIKLNPTILLSISLSLQ